MIFRQQVVGIHLPLGSIGGGPLAATPAMRKVEVSVAIDHAGNCRIQLLRKQGIELLSALNQTLSGHPLLPAFS